MCRVSADSLFDNEAGTKNKKQSCRALQIPDETDMAPRLMMAAAFNLPDTELWLSVFGSAAETDISTICMKPDLRSHGSMITFCSGMRRWL